MPCVPGISTISRPPQARKLTPTKVPRIKAEECVCSRRKEHDPSWIRAKLKSGQRAQGVIRMGTQESLGTFMGIDDVLKRIAGTAVVTTREEHHAFGCLSEIAACAAHECFELGLEKVVANPARQVAPETGKDS